MHHYEKTKAQAARRAHLDGPHVGQQLCRVDQEQLGRRVRARRDGELRPGRPQRHLHEMALLLARLKRHVVKLYAQPAHHSFVLHKLDQLDSDSQPTELHARSVPWQR